MGFIDGALGSIGGSIFSGLFNSASGYMSAQQQYKNQSKLNKQSFNYNLKLQNHQNAFSEKMFNRSTELANTAHQREIADLRAAGLNPILTATGGNGAVSTAAMSGGSAGMSGGSAQAVDSGKIDLMNAYATAKQIKNDTALKNSQVKVNDSSIDLNNYLADKAHYESSIARENTQLLQDYGALQKQAEINNLIETANVLKSNTAKNLNDIKNSNALTASQVGLNNSSSWYNLHRALGFSESRSDSNTSGKSAGVGSVHIGGKHFGVNLPSVNGSKNSGSSHSYSRTY